MHESSADSVENGCISSDVFEVGLKEGSSASVSMTVPRVNTTPTINLKNGLEEFSNPMTANVFMRAPVSTEVQVTEFLH